MLAKEVGRQLLCHVSSDVDGGAYLSLNRSHVPVSISPISDTPGEMAGLRHLQGKGDV